MQPVWVMSEDEKRNAGAGAAVLLLIVGLIAGGIWSYNWLFPSESSQLWKASDYKRDIDRTFEDSEWEVISLTAAAEQANFTAEQLTNTGENLRRLKDKVSKLRSDITSLTKVATRLKKSDNVDTRFQAVGYEKHAADAAEKLKTLEEKTNQLEDKLSKKLAGS